MAEHVSGMPLQAPLTEAAHAADQSDERRSDDDGLSASAAAADRAAPDLDYRPRDPRQYRPTIGLIGCGGISEHHLEAYRSAGYRVAALCDLMEARARAQRDAFFPEADVYGDYRELLARDDVEVVDVTTHPGERVPILEAALRASKHVLSQKPFVLDLDVGRRLVDLAERQGVKLAVNQNGRWAPHFAYLRQAVRHGLLGELTGAVQTIHWDHTWVVGTPFDDIHDLVLYDFAIHWFDIITCFFGEQRAKRVYASTTRATGQTARPPLLAHVLIDYEAAQATLTFNATVAHGQVDCTYLAGTRGSATSMGAGLSAQTVTLYTADGRSSPQLEGNWFNDGFHGAMAELLCAIEDGREPDNSARANLRSLGLAFAAIASAHEGTPKSPGEIDRLPTLPA